MIDHIIFEVSDVQRARSFYQAALAPLGYSVAMEWDTFIGFGVQGKADFWIKQGSRTAPIVHVAFRSPDRRTVDAFYQASLKAGGTDNGKPGLRPDYHANYYGAFVLDPDGHNIEAVCHDPA